MDALGFPGWRARRFCSGLMKLYGLQGLLGLGGSYDIEDEGDLPQLA
jgi:hypothetical protein